MSDKEIDATAAFSWRNFGIVISIVYGLAVGWAIWWSGWIDTSKTMELNTLGDFLAGLFAPLAFLWLFVATMLQSQELALQRVELRATNRIAAETSLSMRTQTRIATAREADALIDTLIANLLRSATIAQFLKGFRVFDEDGYGTAVVPSADFKPEGLREVVVTLLDMRTQLIGALAQSPKLSVQIVYPDVFQNLGTRFEEIARQALSATLKKQAELEGVGLNDGRWAAQQIDQIVGGVWPLKRQRGDAVGLNAGDEEKDSHHGHSEQQD